MATEKKKGFFGRLMDSGELGTMQIQLETGSLIKAGLIIILAGTSIILIWAFVKTRIVNRK